MSTTPTEPGPGAAHEPARAIPDPVSPTVNAADATPGLLAEAQGWVVDTDVPGDPFTARLVLYRDASDPGLSIPLTGDLAAAISNQFAAQDAELDALVAADDASHQVDGADDPDAASAAGRPSQLTAISGVVQVDRLLGRLTPRAQVILGAALVLIVVIIYALTRK